MRLTITREKKVAAEIILTHLGGDAYEIEYLHVAPEHRRQGMATTLLKKAKERCRVLIAFLDPDGTGMTRDQMKAWLTRNGFSHRWYEFPGGGLKRAMIFKRDAKNDSDNPA